MSIINEKKPPRAGKKEPPKKNGMFNFIQSNCEPESQNPFKKKEISFPLK